MGHSRRDADNLERTAIARLAERNRTSSAYSHIQATTQQTLGYSLVDSPVGLCAWILEKVWTWSDHAGDLWEVSPTQALDNVTLYWLSSAGVSSARLYWESIAEVTTWFSQTGRRAHHRTYWMHRLPTGGTTPLPPMGRTSVPLDRPLGRAPGGGHFGAWEQPGLFISEVRAVAKLSIDQPDRLHHQETGLGGN